VKGDVMGCEWKWEKSYKEEIRERERRYREKIRRKLEKYNSMIDKAKVKQQIKADIMQVLKEAMNQEIPEHVLRNRIISKIREPFDIFEKKWIFDNVFISRYYNERFYNTLDELDKGANVARGTFKLTVKVEAKIDLETLADSGFGASTLMDETIYELVTLAEITVEFTADVRKQGDKYLVKVLHVYDVDVMLY
jgi:hypothetical protein